MRDRSRSRAPQSAPQSSGPKGRPDTQTGPFTDLGVDPRIVRDLAREGIVTPRPIQADTVAAGLAGRDVCGRAPTGSGQTLAFGLPIAHMEPGDGRPVGLVLAPTRELALQIAAVLDPMASRRRLVIRTLIGGTNLGKDIRALDRGVDLVIGCPGRMIDLMKRGHLDLSEVRMAVLDEADRMADMGFIPDVTRLLDATDCIDGQLLMFSATLDQTTAKLEKRYQTDPVRVDVGTAPQAVGEVSHTWHVVDRPQRRTAIENVLDKHSSALVFTRTKRGADRLARQLNTGGHRSAAIHGDRSQSQRQRALANFIHGSVKVLVATDIAARGIHVDDIDVVIHFDLPATAEDYTHRSGRTGRAGSDGAVVALVCNDSKGDAEGLAKRLPYSLDIVGKLSGGNSGAVKPAGGKGGNKGGPRSNGQGQGQGQGRGRGGGGKGGNRGNAAATYSSSKGQSRGRR
ncbi:MAG: DEAD/DEAH box helicase [Euzebya sp.]